MPVPLLEFDNVKIRYGDPGSDGCTDAVRGVSAAVCAGQTLGIVGESGSGKSTLAKAAMGLLGNGGSVWEGDIRFMGASILTLPESRMREMRGLEMTMVFQDCLAALTPTRKVADQVVEMAMSHMDAGGGGRYGGGLGNSGRRRPRTKVSRSEREAIEARACSFLLRLNVKDPERVMASYPFELSGGLGQRVGIMMALFPEPKVLLLDEPTSALDVVSQRQVVDELAGIGERADVAMMLVTHNIGVVRKLADHIVVMKDGMVMESGPASSVLEDPQSSYTRELLEAVPRG